MQQYELSPYLRCFESALYRTTTTLVRAAGVQLLVDPNWLPAELATIAREVGSASTPLYLLFTHSDYDHIVGYGAFQPRAVVASRAFAERPDKDREVETLLNWDAKHYISRPYPLAYPEVDLAVAGEAEPLSLGGLELITWPAPGHTADGLLTYVPAADTLIVGDYLSNIEFPFIYHDLAAYAATLDRLESIIRSYRPRFLVPGHGDVCTSEAEMLHRLQRDRAYLQEIASATAAGQPTTTTDWPGRFPYSRGLQDEHAANLARTRAAQANP